MGLLRQVMEPYFARFGISGSQWGILRALQCAEAKGEVSLRLSDLGERLFIQPPSVTAAVDRLEREGLVKRHEFKGDLRVRQVSLTPQGKELVSLILAGHEKQIESLFAENRGDELDTLVALLGKLQAHLGKMAQQQPAILPREEKPAEL
jgi:DNA-binding MarR family transcriptional regulator